MTEPVFRHQGQEECEFIYHTLRQIEKLQTVNDLTPGEAKVLRANLRNVLDTGAGPDPKTAQDIRRLSKRHVHRGAAQKPRRSTGGSGQRARGKDASRNVSMGNASRPTSQPKLPPIGNESTAEIAVDEWSAITMAQDAEFQAGISEKMRQATINKYKNKAQLDQHINLQEQQRQRRSDLESKFAQEQQKQLERWQIEEQQKVAKRMAKLTQEKTDRDAMMVLRNEQRQRERDRMAREDAEAVARAKQDLADEQARMLKKKTDQAKYLLKVKEENKKEQALKIKQQQADNVREQQAVKEYQAMMDKQDKDRQDYLDSQQARLEKLMSFGAKAVASTQGRIDDEDRRIQLHAERKSREIDEAASKKAALAESRRREMVSGLNYQMELQEQRRLKEIDDAKGVAVQYRKEADRFAREEIEAVSHGAPSFAAGFAMPIHPASHRLAFCRPGGEEESQACEEQVGARRPDRRVQVTVVTLQQLHLQVPDEHDGQSRTHDEQRVAGKSGEDSCAGMKICILK